MSLDAVTQLAATGSQSRVTGSESIKSLTMRVPSVFALARGVAAHPSPASGTPRAIGSATRAGEIRKREAQRASHARSTRTTAVLP